MKNKKTTLTHDSEDGHEIQKLLQMIEEQRNIKKKLSEKFKAFQPLTG